MFASAMMIFVAEITISTQACNKFKEKLINHQRSFIDSNETCLKAILIVKKKEKVFCFGSNVRNGILSLYSLTVSVFFFFRFWLIFSIIHCQHRRQPAKPIWKSCIIKILCHQSVIWKFRRHNILSSQFNASSSLRMRKSICTSP